MAWSHLVSRTFHVLCPRAFTCAVSSVWNLSWPGQLSLPPLSLPGQLLIFIYFLAQTSPSVIYSRPSEYKSKTGAILILLRLAFHGPTPRPGWAPLFYGHSLPLFFLHRTLIIYNYICSVFFTPPDHKPGSFINIFVHLSFKRILKKLVTFHT